MTTIYFVRHALPDRSDPDNRNRALLPDGREDARIVAETLKGRKIDAVLCSPYRRSLETVRETAELFGMTIRTDERLRERRTGIPAEGLARHPERWKSPVWEESWGESPADVRTRYLDWLGDALAEYRGKSIVVGSHGTALSILMNAILPDAFGYDFFLRTMRWMPYILRVDFDGDRPVGHEMLAYVEK